MRNALNKAFDLVHRSNMSKLCKTEKEAKETVAWYQTYYKPNTKTPVYDSPTYEQVGKYWIVHNKSTGKRLKSINYTPVSFEGMLT